MFSKAILVTLASAAFVFAAPQGAPAKAAPAAPALPAPIPISECNTGSTQCCNSVSSVNDPSTAQLLGLLGAAVQGITGTVGINCNPITGIGGSVATNCAQQPACCQGSKLGGLINVGCVPISA